MAYLRHNVPRGEDEEGACTTGSELMQATDVFPLVPRRRLVGLSFGGMHSARRGSGSDVAGSRPYQPGDDIRAIDWGASARLSSARAADVAAVLALARIGAIVTGVGTLVLLAFGIWLVHLGHWRWGSAWISAALALLAAAAILGAFGGQWPKQARLLATRLAAEGREDDGELRRLLDHPLELALNYG